MSVSNLGAMPNAAHQTFPPSVRDILTAYAQKGTQADREILIAILQAKAAEDQRITALATLNQQYLVLQRHTMDASALAVWGQQQLSSASQAAASPRTSSRKQSPPPLVSPSPPPISPVPSNLTSASSPLHRHDHTGSQATLPGSSLSGSSSSAGSSHRKRKSSDNRYADDSPTQRTPPRAPFPDSATTARPLCPPNNGVSDDGPSSPPRRTSSHSTPPQPPHTSGPTLSTTYSRRLDIQSVISAPVAIAAAAANAAVPSPTADTRAPPPIAQTTQLSSPTLSRANRLGVSVRGGDNGDTAMVRRGAPISAVRGSSGGDGDDDDDDESDGGVEMDVRNH